MNIGQPAKPVVIETEYVKITSSNNNSLGRVNLLHSPRLVNEVCQHSPRLIVIGGLHQYSPLLIGQLIL